MEATSAADSPVSSAKVSELGKALDQTSISSGIEGGSPAAAGDGQGDAGGGEYDDDDEEEEEEDDDEFDDEDEDEDELSAEEVDQLPVKLPTKSPKKRGRTDSMKKALPAPASQRYKHLSDSSADCGGLTVSSPDSATSSTPKGTLLYTATAATVPLNPQSKLMVKDRKGSGMGTPNVHLILDAVKQAPPAKEKSNPRRWSKHEDESLRLAVERSGERNWKAIADQVPGRNHTQCLQRWTKVLKPGLIKGHWTPEEDSKLRELVAEGKKNWGQVASLIPGRTSKQCRERWCNHLDPNINKGSYTEDEDKIIIEMQAKLGNRWSIIAQQLKGRTEDAVKIRWKSLMRGRRAALKEDKAASLASISSASSAASSPGNSTPTERPRPKVAKSPSARPKPKSMPSIKAELDPVSEESSNASTPPAPESQKHAQEMVSSAPIEMQASDIKQQVPPQMMHPDMHSVNLGSNVPMQNVNDLVAASIHNFRMSQQFHPNLVQSGGNIYAGNPTMLGQQQHPGGFAIPNGAYGLQMSQHQSYQLPPGYVMSNDASLVHGYVMPNNFAVSGPMQVQMQIPPGSVPSGASFATQSMGMGMNMGMAGASMPMQPNTAGMTHQGIAGGNVGISASAALSQHGLPINGRPGSAGVNIGLPPASAASAGRVLNTPREEWGSSQTPRSQMMMAEGHASAYELFHQQRLRLMMKEREKQGLSLVSAPSPGQALLTKELEANKERQAIMQKGWKSAVDAMISVNSVNDLVSLDDQQRFDSLLEKVTLSALDPTDEELLDLAGDDTIDL